MKTYSRFCLFVALTVVSVYAGAQSAEWTGNGSGSFWSESSNWAGLRSPESSNSLEIVFSGMGGPSVNDISNPFEVGTLRFGSSAGAFDIAGEPLELYSGIVNVSANEQHFSSKLIFAAPSKISAGVGIDAAGGITSTDEDSVITISGQKLILSGQNYLMLGEHALGADIDVAVNGGNTENMGAANFFTANGNASLTIKDGAFFCSPAGIVYDNGSNSITVSGEETVLSTDGANLYLNTGSSLLVDSGAVVTNVSDLRLGDNSKSDISLNILNGGKVYANKLTYRGTRRANVRIASLGKDGTPSRLTLGSFEPVNYSVFDCDVTVDAGGEMIVSNAMKIGYSWSSPCGSNCCVRIINGGMAFFGGEITLGNSSSCSNLIQVGSSDSQNGTESILRLNADSLFRIGWASGFGNQFLIDSGGVATNGNVIVGDERSGEAVDKYLGSSMVVTNGGRFFGRVRVGLRTNGGKLILSGKDSLIDACGLNLESGSGRDNLIIINDGATAAGINEIRVGYVQRSLAYAYGNGLEISGGAKVFSSGACCVGRTESYEKRISGNNYVTMIGNGTSWDMQGGNLRIGYANFANTYATNNFATVGEGASLTNVNALTVGYKVAVGAEKKPAVSEDNRLIVAGGNIYSSSMTVASGNVFSIVFSREYESKPVEVSGRVVLEEGSIIQPLVDGSANDGVYTILKSGELVDNGVIFDPGNSPYVYNFFIRDNCAYIKLSNPGTVAVIK